MIWLHSDYILTTFWLHFDYILITIWLHFDYILWFWLHSDCILTISDWGGEEIVSSKQLHACPSCIYSHMTPQTNLLQILSLRTIDYQLGFPEKQRHCSPPNFESDLSSASSLLSRNSNPIKWKQLSRWGCIACTDAVVMGSSMHEMFVQAGGQTW